MATSPARALVESDAFEACSLAASVSDATGRYLAVNAVGASLLGVDPARLEGVSDATLAPREFARILHANHLRALESDEIVETVEWVLDRVGRRRVAACRFALPGPDGEPWGVCRVDASVEHAGTVRREAQRLRTVADGPSGPEAVPSASARTEPDPFAHASNRADLERATAELAGARAETERLAGELAALRDEHRSASAEAERLAGDAATAGAESERMAAELATAQAETERLVSELTTLRDEHGNASAEAQRLASEAAAARAESERVATELAAATAARDHAEVARAEAETAHRETRADLQRVSADLAAVTRERDAAVAAAAAAATTTATVTLREPIATLAPVPVVAGPSASVSCGLDVSAALRELTRVAGAQTDAEGVLRAAAAPLGRDLGWEAAATWPMPGPSGTSSCAGAWTDAPAGLDLFATSTWRAVLRSGHGHTGSVAASGQTVWLTGLSADDPCPRIAAAARAGLQTAAIVRVDGPDGPLGVLEVFSRAGRAQDPMALDALTTAAELLGRIATLVARSRQPQWGSSRR